MTENYMLTIPRTVSKKAIRTCVLKGVKKYVWGWETGKDGYKHYQIRVQASEDSYFTRVHTMIPQAHIEKCSDTWEYERKEGHYITSEDTVDIRKIRFGKLTDAQKRVLKALRSQNDRQVDVYYDPKGNHGKTWLTVHLWETGQALVVPRASTTAEKLSAYVCSAWAGEPIIIIDIPRASKPTTALYETIEEVKDGLVFDHRYSGRSRNIRGTKVIVFTNTKLNLKALSGDRWRLHGMTEDTGTGDSLS